MIAEQSRIATPPQDRRTDAPDAVPAWKTTLRVDVVRDVRAFAGLQREWDALLDASSASLFNSWEWLYPWYQHLGSDRQLRIYTARNAERRLVGLFPLSIERRWAGPVPVRRLAFLGDDYVGSDYLDIVAARGYEEGVTRAFTRKLIAKGAGWDILDLIDMESTSPTLAFLRSVLRSQGFSTQISACDVCPYELLPSGQNWDGFLRTIGRRDNYLRRLKWLQKQPGFSIEKAEEGANLPAALEDFFRLHASRWEAAGGSDGITGPQTEAFHRATVPLLARRGQIRFYTIRLGEQALASVYGMLQGDKFIYYQSGYDPEWASKSVGLVLVAETFKDSVDAGLREYDFLRGTEGYKAEWTTRHRETAGLRAFRPFSPGDLLNRQEEGSKLIRSWVKGVLPADLVDKIRRIRHDIAAA